MCLQRSGAVSSFGRGLNLAASDLLMVAARLKSVTLRSPELTVPSL